MATMMQIQPPQCMVGRNHPATHLIESISGPIGTFCLEHGTAMMARLEGHEERILRARDELRAVTALQAVGAC